MDILIRKTPWFRNANIGILILRVGVGCIFIAIGWLKAYHMALTLSFFASFGFAAVWAYIVSAAEFFGGLVLVLGMHVRFFAKLLALVMIVAIALSWPDMNVIMAPLILLFVNIALAFTGAGRYSVAAKQKKHSVY